MQFLILNPGLHFKGGNEILIIEFCTRLLASNHAVDLVTTYINPGIESELKKIGVNVHSLGISDERMVSRIFLMFFAIIVYIIRERKRAGVNIFLNFPANLFCFLFRKQRNYWYCNEATMFHLKINNSKSIRKFLLEAVLFFEQSMVRRFMRIIFVSDFLNKRLANNYHIPVIVLPYGVDKKLQLDRADHCARDIDFLQVGVFTPEKRQLESLQVLSRMGRIPSKILLIGNQSIDKSYFKEVESYSEDLKCVEILGQQDSNSIRMYMRRSKVLIHPVQQQGGWLSALEGLACGCILITTFDAPFARHLHRCRLAVITENLEETLKLNADADFDKEGKVSVRVTELFSWDRFARKFLRIITTIS